MRSRSTLENKARRRAAPLSSRPFHRANLDQPSFRWSQRDWFIFRAAYCSRTPSQEDREREVVTAFRSGTPVSQIAKRSERSKQLVYMILAAAQLRDERRLEQFYDKRRNLGRPLDMGGPRGVWIEDDEGLFS